MSEDDSSMPDADGGSAPPLPVSRRRLRQRQKCEEPSVSLKFAYRPESCEDGLRKWNEELVRIAKSVGTGQDWEDLYQSICTELCRSWSGVAEAEYPLAYALRVAARTKLAFLERRKRNRNREPLFAIDDVDATASPYAEVRDETIDLAKLLLAVLQELPNLERSAYEYVRLQEYTYAEVAEILDLSPTAVTNLLRKVDQRIDKAHKLSTKQERSRFSLRSAPVLGRLFRKREGCTDTSAHHSASPQHAPPGYKPGGDPLEAT